MPHARQVAVFLAVLAAGCGRLGYGPEPVVEEVVLTALDSTTIVYGDSVRFRVGVLPAAAAQPGTTIKLSVAYGGLSAGDSMSHGLEVEADEQGDFPEIRFHALLDVPPGRVVSIDSDAERTTGDTEVLVEEVPDGTVDIRGVTYTVPSGYTLDEPLGWDPLDVEITDRGAQLLFIREESVFADGPYVVAEGGDVYAARGPTLLPFASTAGSVAGTAPAATDRIVQTAFTAPGSEYTEALLLCVRGASGGLYALSAGGEFSLVRSGGCNGVLVDDPLSVASSDWRGPVYVHTEANELVALAPDGSDQMLMSGSDGLRVAQEGLRLFVCPSYLLPAKLVMVSSGSAGIGADGFAMAVEPWDAPIGWLEGLAEPTAAAYAFSFAFGAALVVALGGTGEVRLYRDDGSSALLAGGLSMPDSVAVDPNGEDLWIVESGRGRILRLRPVP